MAEVDDVRFGFIKFVLVPPIR